MSTPIAAQFHEFTVQPGATVTAWGEGDSFLVVQSNARLEIMRDGAPFLPYEQGDREDLPPGISFNRLEVRNPTLIAAAVKLYSGYGRRIQQRQAVIEPPVKVRGYNGVNAGTLPGGASVLLSGLPQAGEIRRKAVTISNDDPNLNLKLRDADGMAVATVYAGFPLIFPISEPVYLFNPNPTAIAYAAGELFWIS